MDGQGVFNWPSGNSYKGSFKKNSIAGSGTFTWANGNVYEGTFSEDVMHGKGRFYWALSGNQYDG